MTSTLIPVSLKGVQHILDIDEVSRPFFEDPSTLGRYMMVIVYNGELLTAVDFAVLPEKAIMTVHYAYNLVGAKISDFPVTVPMSESSSVVGNYFTFDFINHCIYISSTIALSNVLFRTVIFPNSYCGLTITGIDRIVENTVGNGIDVDNIVRFNSGIENISSSGIVTLVDSTNIQWTNVNAIARRIGSNIYISFEATLNSNGVIGKTTYDLGTVSPIDKFNNTFKSHGQLFIDGENPGIMICQNSNLQIQLPSDIPLGESRIVSGSLTYIV